MLHSSEGKRTLAFHLLSWPRPPALVSYGVAVLSVGAALAIARLLDIYLVTAPSSLFHCAIMLSAWFGGIRRGLFAVALSLLAFDYFFVTPTYSFAMEIKEVPRFIIFTLTAMFVGSMSAAQKNTADSLSGARDDLTRTVQELRGTNEALQAENAERQRAEDTNRRLAAIFESTDDAVFISSLEGTITSWNKGAERMYGYPDEEVMGRHISVLIPDDHADDIRNIIDPAGPEESLRLETVGVRKDGQRIDAALTISAIKGSEGQIVGASVIARDITERKRIEEQQSRFARYTLLRAEVSAAFNESEGSLRGVLQECAEAVVRHLDAAFARIWTLHDDKSLLELQASAGLYTHLDGTHARIPVGSLKIGLIASERKPHFTNSVQEDERVTDKEWSRREGMISFAGYPLEVKGRIVGVIAMFARQALEQSTIDVLESIAPIIAQGIERNRAEDALRRSEADLAEAQRLSRTGSFAWNVSTGEIHWSEETFRLYQYDPTMKPTMELIMQRVHPDDAALVNQTVERALQGQKDFDFEHRLLLPDGSVKYLHAVAHASRDESGSFEFVGALRDITITKQTEASLFEQASLLNLTHDTIFVRDMNDVITYWNRGAEGLYGWTKEEALGQVTHELLRTVFPVPIDEIRAELLRTGRWEGELVHSRSDGTQVVVASRWSLQRDEQQRPLAVMETNNDITERKGAEEKIRQQELELRQLIDLTPQHVAVLGPDRSRLFSEGSPNINQAALDYHGLTLEEWQSSDPRRLFHPDDWERMMREDRSNFERGLPYESEARLLRHDGVYRWFLFRHNPMRDEQGRITRWYVAATDIEDRMQAEQRLHNENIALREEIDTASMFEEIVGTSPALQAVLARVTQVAPTDSTVLITGETGTGKELIARAIHKLSKRSARAFISVNCAAIPPSLVASELFGHEKGAFTGAFQRRLGRFELAEGGTIFLDEIGELPAETQTALLRVLQEHEFERVGGNRSIRTDVRVIVATNRDLQAAMAAGTFRTDLFYRLNVFPIEMPPLRERREDTIMLVEYFIDRFARNVGKKIRSINKQTLTLLQSYSWPGNIRELQNVVERAVIVCEGEIFSIDESWLAQQPAQEQEGSQALTKKSAADVRAMIEAALAETRGRVSGPSGAAARLGIPPSTLESKIKALKINKNRFKSTYSATA